MGVGGGGVLRATIRKTQREAGSGVELRIEDTGPGIAPEMREQIFNPFVTTKKSGVGLGLSIVSKIVDGHHGAIRIENANIPSGDATQAQGACFVIFLRAATQTSTPSTSDHLVIS